MRHAKRMVCVILVVMTASCGGAGGTSSPVQPVPTDPGMASTSNAIAIGDNFFNPSSTTVPAGTVVTWTWGGGVRHNVTFDDGAASATQLTGTYTRTFSSVGAFKYHCTIHGSAMSGVITVK